MMDYKIRFASDDDMPAGQDFLLFMVGPQVVIAYRASAACPLNDPDRAARVLEDSWAAYRALERELLSA